MICRSDKYQEHCHKYGPHPIYIWERLLISVASYENGISYELQYNIIKRDTQYYGFLLSLLYCKASNRDNFHWCQLIIIPLRKFTHIYHFVSICEYRDCEMIIYLPLLKHGPVLWQRGVKFFQSVPSIAAQCYSQSLQPVEINI